MLENCKPCEPHPRIVEVCGEYLVTEPPKPEQEVVRKAYAGLTDWTPALAGLVAAERGDIRAAVRMYGEYYLTAKAKSGSVMPITKWLKINGWPDRLVSATSDALAEYRPIENYRVFISRDPWDMAAGCVTPHFVSCFGRDRLDVLKGLIEESPALAMAYVTKDDQVVGRVWLVVHTEVQTGEVRLVGASAHGPCGALLRALAAMPIGFACANYSHDRGARLRGPVRDKSGLSELWYGSGVAHRPADLNFTLSGSFDAAALDKLRVGVSGSAAVKGEPTFKVAA